jgi:anaerobic magnesium-protoporphyrin IX monomethyl ester cyclase
MRLTLGNHASYSFTVMGAGGISTTLGGAAASKLRLLLVNPTIVDKREHVHIGLGTVGTYVKLHSPHEVRILDFMAFRRTWRERLRRVLDEFRPDLVGMYISSPYFHAARTVAQEIKRVAPRVPVLAGGHHPTLSPDDTMTERAFDMLIIGEGEKPMVTLLDTMAAGRSLDEVPGLWWRDGDTIRKIPKATLLESAAMPGVDWSLHDEETLRANFYFWGVLPVMASRGCPARCSFCSITNVQRLYAGEKFLRFRDPRQVVGEIEADYERYRAWGLRIIYFYDLNFLVNPRWLRQFTDEYKRRGLNRRLKWSAYTRADHVNPDTLESLRDSGCVNLRVGIEAANPFMRNVLYEKDVSQEVLLDAIRRIKSLGISVTGYFMAGGPGERPEWLMESLELVKREGVEYPVFFLYKPLAGTDILDRAEELGSHLLADSMTANADFLHGVNMEHEHIKAWQLKAYVLFTQALFGPSLVLAQARRAGWRYLPRLAKYMARGMAAGFSFYGALTYFIFYGYDHLVEPLRLKADPAPGRGWRALMRATRLWMRHSGEPEPEMSKAKPRPISAHVAAAGELATTGTATRHGTEAASAGVG